MCDVHSFKIPSKFHRIRQEKGPSASDDPIVHVKYASGSLPDAKGPAAASAFAAANDADDQNVSISLRHIHICLSVEFLVALNNFVVVALNNSSKHLDSLRRLQELQAADAAAAAAASSGAATNDAGSGPAAGTRLSRMSRDARASVVRRFSVNPAAATTTEELPAPSVLAASAAASAAKNETSPAKAIAEDDSGGIGGKMEVEMSLEHPEVVLVADAKSENSKAILLSGLISLKYLQVGSLSSSSSSFFSSTGFLRI